MRGKIKRGIEARFWTYSLIPLFLLSIASLGNSATIDVQVVNFQFSPATVNIQVGDTVRWTFVSGGHTTTSGSGCSPNGMWDSGIKSSGSIFPFTFSTPGTFPYFCIPHCGIGMVGSVVVSGPPSTLNLLIRPASVTFGTVTLGQTADQVINLSNEANSTGTLTGNVGTLASPFAVTIGEGPFSLAPGQSKSVTVRFTPSAGRTFNASLAVTHNATNQPSPTSIPLSGTGQTPPSAMNLIINPTSVNYGEVKAGLKANQTLTLTNGRDSNGPLSISVEGLAAPFTVIRGGGNISLRPGQSKSIPIQFYPQASGVFSDGLRITHNATNQSSPVDLPIVGTGTPPDPLADPITQAITKGNVTVRLLPVTEGLTAPNWGIPAPGDPTRLFVSDQPGILWAIDLATGVKTVFGDFSGLLAPIGIGGPGTFDERGFLGFAFHPHYSTNGLLYTFTSEPVDGPADFSTLPPDTVPNGQSVIREWRVPAPMNPASVVESDRSRILLRIDKPQFNHNGGGLNFGPDGMLYISLGDGGAGDDQGIGHSPQGNGQDRGNLLGKILRIDPTETNSTNGQYGVPADNPFFPGGSGPFGGENGCGDGVCDEIYAYGLRNPFRFSFDKETGDLYAGDVGQNDIEEVNVIFPGGNYGWRIKEGAFCFEPNGENAGFVFKLKSCASPGLIDPVAQYDHDEGISAIGGFVYRGAAIKSLQGRYVFGDYSRTFAGNNGRLFFLSTANIVSNGKAKKSKIQEVKLAGQEALNLSVLGFGEDANGELYLLGNSTGVPFGTTGVVLKLAP